MTNLINNFPYVGIFVALMLGGIGLPVPEDATLLLSGFLIAHGTIKLFPTFLVVYPLLLITDFIVFWVGKKYGRMLLQHKRFSKLISPNSLSRLEEKFRKRGALVVVFGRYILGLRTQIFLAAGVARMSLTKFLIADAAAALVTLALFWGGIKFVGDSRVRVLETAATKIGCMATFVILIMLASWIVYKCQRKRIKKIVFH